MSVENVKAEEGKFRDKTNKKKGKKNIVKKIMALSLATLAGLGAAELALREYAKFSSSPLLMYDTREIQKNELKKHRNRPNEIVFESKCNSQGYFDDQEFIVAKKSGVRRVIAISDSFGVSRVPIRYHAFTKGESLEGKFGNPRWEIYNFSMGGTNPEAYLYILREFALEHNPDLTLIGFFCGNDLHVNDELGSHNKAGSKIRRRERLSEKIRLLKLIKRLYMIHKAGYLFGEKGKRVIADDDSEMEKLVDIHPEEWWQDINNEEPVFPEEAIMNHEKRDFSFNAVTTEHPNYLRLKDIFAEMKGLTNNRIAVVIFPMACQVDSERYKRIISGKKNKHLREKIEGGYTDVPDDKIENVDKDRVYNNVKNMLEEENIPAIDVLGPLREGHKKYGRVYHLSDTHLNYWGNHIVAGEIRKFLGDYFNNDKF